MGTRTRWVILATAALALAACGDRRTPEEKGAALGAEIRGALVEARAAAEKGDGKGARRGADKAKEALAKLETLAAEHPVPAIAGLVEPSREASREAAEAAGLAENRAYVADRCASLKARAYRGTEGLAITAFCQAGALGCDQAAQKPLESLPGPLRGVAQSAAELDRALTGRLPRADGTPDYAAIAQSLRAFSAAPPAELHMALAASHVVSASNDWALIEIQQVDPGALPKDLRLVYHVERVAIFRLHRLDYLAKEETRVASVAGADVTWFTPQVQAGMHLFLAVSYIQERDYLAADLEAARAVQLDPNNPLAVFVTGERLLAEGKREAAAESLEKAAAGTKQEWVAQAVAERVRQLRDSPEQAEPILLSGPFFRSVLVHYLKEGSTAGAQLVGGLVTDMQAKFEAALKGSGR